MDSHTHACTHTHTHTPHNTHTHTHTHTPHNTHARAHTHTGVFIIVNPWCCCQLTDPLWPTEKEHGAAEWALHNQTTAMIPTALWSRPGWSYAKPGLTTTKTLCDDQWTLRHSRLTSGMSWRKGPILLGISFREKIPPWTVLRHSQLSKQMLWGLIPFLFVLVHLFSTLYLKISVIVLLCCRMCTKHTLRCKWQIAVS